MASRTVASQAKQYLKVWGVNLPEREEGVLLSDAVTLGVVMGMASACLSFTTFCLLWLAGLAFWMVDSKDMSTYGSLSLS